MNRALEAFERLILRILSAMMALAIIAATANLIWVFIKDLLSSPFDFLTVTELLDVFATFLIVLIGLELLETINVYHTEHHVRVETVLLVSLIAVLRKVITLEVKDVPAVTLFAVAVMIIALAVAYWLMRRSGLRVTSSEASTTKER